MKIRLFIFCLIIIGVSNSYWCLAQSDKVEAPRLAVKLSLLHQVYFYPSVQIAVEHKLFKNINLQYDFGYVLDYNFNDTDDYSNKRGFRGIAELRYYVPSPPKIPFYVAGEFYYSRIKFDRSKVVGYDCTGDCTYFEYVRYKVEHHHQGIGLKFGLLLFPGWNKNRSVFFDINAGFAYRTISYTDIGKPSASNATFFDNDDSPFFSPSEKDNSDPRIILGIRVGYRFF